MKATIDLDPDVQAAAERLASAQKKNLAQVLTDLVREALGLGTSSVSDGVAELERRNGFDPFPERNGEQVTIDSVRRLCDEDGI